jgi:photosystem II cytochrome c550
MNLPMIPTHNSQPKSSQPRRDQPNRLKLLFIHAISFAATVIVCWIGLIAVTPASWADDLYIRKYLGVREPVAIQLDAQGQTQLFSAAELSAGKQFFEGNCKNCHVGGSTLPDPTVPLSLAALQQAMPPRDNVLSLVAFLRQPMTYDGTEATYSCREVPESWLSDQEADQVAAFILRSAQKAPGWGNTTF